MTIENSKRLRVYFADTQQKWSTLLTDSAMDMIDGLSRHGDAADPLGEQKQPPAKAA